MIPSYTCLDQSSPEPAGLQKIDLDHQCIAHRLYPIINHQQTKTNIHEANKTTNRTVHQSYKNSMKSL